MNVHASCIRIPTNYAHNSIHDTTVPVTSCLKVATSLKFKFVCPNASVCSYCLAGCPSLMIRQASPKWLLSSEGAVTTVNITTKTATTHHAQLCPLIIISKQLGFGTALLHSPACLWGQILHQSFVPPKPSAASVRDNCNHNFCVMGGNGCHDENAGAMLGILIMNEESEDHNDETEKDNTWLDLVGISWKCREEPRYNLDNQSTASLVLICVQSKTKYRAVRWNAGHTSLHVSNCLHMLKAGTQRLSRFACTACPPLLRAYDI